MTLCTIYLLLLFLLLVWGMLVTVSIMLILIDFCYFVAIPVAKGESFSVTLGFQIFYLGLVTGK